MANTNPQAIAWTNNRARPLADMMAQLYTTCKDYIEQWNAQNVVAVIPNDSTIIADGAATDGRAQVTDAQVTNMLNRATEIVNWCERDTLDTSGTQNNAVLNTINAVAVNTGAKF